jgi:hypothetical protein
MYNEKHMQQQKKKPREQLEKEKKETELAWENMMLRHGEKRAASPIELSDDEEVEVKSSALSTQRK